MQIIPLLSEFFLSLTGFLTYYFLLRKAPQRQIVLWGTFVLSVALTSFFSALYFAGISGMNQWHDFFKNIGSSTGIVLLVVGIYLLVFKKKLSPKTIFFMAVFGFAFALISMYLNLEKVFIITPLIGIFIVFVFGIIAFLKGNKKIGIYLFLATIFSVLANTFTLLKLPLNPISAYCFLLACVLVCFGLVAKNSIPLKR